MPLPTAYTEDALAAFICVELGPTADLLEWVPGTYQVTEAVSDVEAALGIADVAASTHVAGLRALARLFAWRRARSALATSFDFSADGLSVKRDQLYQHAKDEVESAEYDCAALGVAGIGGSGTVGIARIERGEDPYQVRCAAPRGGWT